MGSRKKGIWIFGDYRNYFQNRVTLQLLARAAELAPKIDGEVCAVIFGHAVDEYVREYIAHGARKVYVIDHPGLKVYGTETHAALLTWLARRFSPEIILVGATDFGRELAPRVAKRLGTGLTADCIRLSMDDNGLLVQTAPAFGGNLLAKTVTPDHRPQMATVRPGTFQELPHDDHAVGEIVPIALPGDIPEPKARVVRSERISEREQRLEEAHIVVCGGRGMASKTKFKKLFELARLLGGEVGATRPIVYSKWIAHDALVGQAGKHISPKILFSFGISGAIQHTAAINDADLIVAINKNPEAPMMKMADAAIVADANQVCSSLIRELRRRIRE